MHKLHVVVTSTREGRVGAAIGQWTFERAKAHGKFDAELVDLKEVNLPAMMEPKHPRLRQYEHEHTKKWSAKVESADAFVFVTPEYNHGMPPALLNAFDHLFVEWNYKPCAFVSYGGVSGGCRSVEMSKWMATSLKMMPLFESVTIPFFNKSMKDGVFEGDDTQAKAATAMLDELVKWSTAMKTMRA